MGAGRNAAGISVKLRTLVVCALAIVMVAALGLLSWQLHTKSGDLDREHSLAADKAHAEQVALDYATGAADMDFRDLTAWRGRLTEGTTPELSDRLTQAASSMEQIISPLQWVATSTPVTAKVSSESNGVYAVDCFVRVLTRNSQAPDGIQSTATYQLSIDSGNNWTISDIGGIDLAVTPTSTPR